MFYRIKNNSNISTTRQQDEATLNKSKPFHATNRPTTNAAIPEYTLWVAFIIAGNVITASVTYGT